VLIPVTPWKVFFLKCNNVECVSFSILSSDVEVLYLLPNGFICLRVPNVKAVW